MPADRLTIDEINSDQLDALYDRLDENERLKLLVAASAEPGHAVRRVVALEAENAKLRDWLAHCTHKPRVAALEAAIARVQAIAPYEQPVHGDRSIGYQMGWNDARDAVLAALDEQPDTRREQYAEAIRAAARTCSEDCDLPDKQCAAQHPIQVTCWTHGQVSDVEGPINAIVNAVLAATDQPAAV